ncbi:prepilin peptidase [Desulfoscipio geothermicus]|uniref:Prepilin leader peptidase/N-methyltransferase n=1 Tax=Desulfoscipio geothermicus DSM 3669 TaxID=1121426 RepID=A0A1I6DBI4_9FIRM|nr:A24 family peptidase [Desulfoscipio geothermicus]SFR02804.1 leader peptidase (prepilin peptidase) / N-methyltransferase [Desulfoscipio geothermicus DSM 3669]
MIYMDDVFVFVLGTCIGSFLNVCIYRIPEGNSVVTGSSYCYSCGHKLSFFDMVPVLSYIFLRGRCRYCGAGFSPQYPLVEFVTGLLYLLVFYKFGYAPATLLFWVFFSILAVVSVIDLHHRIIPDGLLITGTVLGLPLVLWQSIDYLISGIIGFLTAGIIMFLIAVLSKGGMGGGDIKLSAVMGLYLGWQGVLVALFLAFLAGGLAGVLLLAAGRKGRKDALPFGPFLALGGAVAAIWGRELLAWYMAVVGMG